MKKITILILAIGLIGLFSCKKDETQAVLTNYNAAQLLTPPPSSAYVLTKVRADSVMAVYTWTAATYDPSNLVPPVYSLEMDTIGNDFGSPKVIYSGAGLTYSITEGSMNGHVLGTFKGIPDSLAMFEFRVKTQLGGTGEAATKYSDPIIMSITPYNDVVVVSPIYLLGDATTVGWDNTKALEMTHIGDKGQYVIVEHLLATKMIKFIAGLGAWAPQWGTDASGTPTNGNLVYRPDETVPDPVAIPSADVEGDYWIMADTANLLYEVSLTSSQLFLLGSATTAGWDNTAGLPFTKVSPGIFTITTTLTAGGMKFLEVLGQWAPQWGTDATAAGDGGPLFYRPTESEPDPAEIPSPGAGTYTINVNLATKTYTIVSK